MIVEALRTLIRRRREAADPSYLHRAQVSKTPVRDPRKHDPEEPVERRLTCGHADWHEVTASLRNPWCRECQDTVEAEFRTLDGEPIEP